MEYIKNYIPESMSFSEGFLGPKNPGPGYFMKADYEKAKKIITELIDEGLNIDFVQIGLDGDFNCCSDIIYENNSFKKADFWDSSCWAKPIIIVNFHDEPSRMYETWKKEEEKTLI